MNTGPKKSLGVSDAADCAAESASKHNDVLGRTVGQCVFGLGPHELIRVKLRGIRREPMHMEALVTAQKFLNDETPVDCAAIPKEYNRPAQVTEKVVQESDDLHTGDVDAVQTEVKSKPLPQRGYGDGRDGRNPIPLIAVSEDGRLPDRCPGLADVRDEEEPAFVEKYEMGPKSSGFFYTRPLVFLPMGDGFLVSLCGPTLRLLPRPFEIRHHPPHMARVVMNPEVLFD